MYQLDFHEDLGEDLDKLPEDVYDEVYKMFGKLKSDPYRYSKPLFDLAGRDLRGCRKTYLYDAKYRIISRIENGTVQIVNIIAVGKREDFEVYDLAYSRLS